MHLGNGGAPSEISLVPRLRESLLALKGEDPPPKRQAAITAEFLRDLLKLSRFRKNRSRHKSELIAAAFFLCHEGLRVCQNKPPRKDEKDRAKRHYFS